MTRKKNRACDKSHARSKIEKYGKIKKQGQGTPTHEDKTRKACKWGATTPEQSTTSSKSLVSRSTELETPLDFK